MRFTHATRGVLSRHDWLPAIRVILDAPVELTELSCPECGSDELAGFECKGHTVISCAQCDESLTLRGSDVIDYTQGADS